MTRRVTGIAATLVLLVGLGSGCGGSVPPFVVGPVHPSSPQATFQAVLDAVRVQGYEPLSADPRTGRIVVPSRLGYGDRYTIHIQCYAGGWVQITPAGPGIYPSRDRLRVPSRMQNELGAFAERLQLRLRGIRG